MNKFEFKNLTPFKWFVLENFPFIEADFDALTEWQLFCKLGKEINKIINSTNTLGTQVESLTDYVTNYFNNLDVQEEINKKLDEMAESGELTDIIAQYLNLAGVLAYDTVNDMKAATNLANGSIAKTLGYANYKDGKGEFYKIRTVTSNDVVDEINIISLNLYTTLIAEKIPNNYLKTIENYDIIVSADGNYDYSSLSAAVNNAQNNSKIFVKNGVYNDEVVNCVGKFLTIVGESKDGVIIQNNTQSYLTPVINIGKGILKNLTLKENGVSDSSGGGYAIHIDNDDLQNSYLYIENCYLYSGSQSAVGIGLRPNGKVYIVNSELYTNFTRTGDNNNGALFCHTSNEAEGTGQELHLKNCYIHSQNTCAIKLQSCKSASNIGYLYAENTSLYSDYYKYKSELLIRDLYENATQHNMLISDENSTNTEHLNYTKYSNQYDVEIGKFLNSQNQYPIKRKILNGDISSNVDNTFDLNNLDNYGGFINIYGLVTETSTSLQLPLNYSDGTNFFRSFLVENAKTLHYTTNLTGTYQIIIEYWATK